MDNKKNAKEILNDVNPLLKDYITEQHISALSKFIAKENIESSEDDVKAAQEAVQKAKELIDEDYFSEPLNYIAATRFGLRTSDLVKLMGTEWDKERFLETTKSLGLEFVEERGDILVIPYLKFKALFFDVEEKESRSSFHADIAFHLKELPENDPFRNSEIFFHLFNSGKIEGIVEHFSALNNQPLLQAADIMGFAYANNINSETIETLAAFEGVERMNLVRRMMNEVYVSIMNNAHVEIAEKFITMLIEKAEVIAAKDPSIKNNLILSLGYMRKATSQLRKGEQENIKAFFEKSLQNLDKMFNAHKNANDFSWEDCETIFNIAFIALEMHQPKAAELIFNVTFNIMEVKEKAEQPESPKKFYIASWYINVCRALLGTNNKEIGLGIFEKGKKVFEETLKLKAQLNSKAENAKGGDFELMTMYNDYADLCAAYDKKDEAVNNYQNALTIGERLAVTGGENVQLLFAPSITLTKLGAYYAANKETEKAEEYLQKALDLRLELLDKHAKDLRLLNDVAASYFALGQLVMTKEDKTQIIDILNKRNDIIDRICEIEPASENSNVLSLDSNLMIGDYYLSVGKTTESMEALERAGKLVSSLMGKQVSENILSRIALLHLKKGMVFSKEEKIKEANENYNIAVNIWEQLYNTTKKEGYKANLEKVKELIVNPE